MRHAQHMEQFNNRREPLQGASSGSGRSNAMVPGLILVGIGVIFLLDNLRIFHDYDLLRYWPLLLVAFGLFLMVDEGLPIRRIVGGIIAAGGGLLLAANFGYIRYFGIGELWPLILIGVGILLLVQRTGWLGESVWGGGHGSFGLGHFRSREYTGDELHEFALFGASKRIITTQDFRGGHASCMFGGISLDLTGAGIVGNVAELKVSAVYGGIVVRIPPTWSAEVRGGGVFGGFADHTMHPVMTPDTKRLIVKGGAVFGGVTIKNGDDARHDAPDWEGRSGSRRRHY
jgi:hypothetical protein